VCAMCSGRVGSSPNSTTGTTNREAEKIYHLCILLVFINNYTTMHGVEHIKLL
jgi:hypothetical protein